MKKALFLFIIIIFNLSALAQENNELIIEEYDVFYDYTHWGFSVMLVLYKDPQFSNNRITKINIATTIPTLQVAFRFHFNHAKALSFNTGFIYTWTPIFKYNYNLKEEDVYDSNDRYFKSKGFTDSYFLIPLNFEYKLRVSQNLYLNVNGGVTGAMRGGFSAHDEYKISVDFEEDIFQIFKFNYRTNDFQFNAQVSTGLYIVFDKFMLRTNLLYNKSFKDIQDGEYSFKGLRVSQPEKGTFSFSGDYFGISSTIYFKRQN